MAPDSPNPEHTRRHGGRWSILGRRSPRRLRRRGGAITCRKRRHADARSESIVLLASMLLVVRWPLMSPAAQFGSGVGTESRSQQTMAKRGSEHGAVASGWLVDSAEPRHGSGVGPASLLKASREHGRAQRQVLTVPKPSPRAGYRCSRVVVVICTAREPMRFRGSSSAPRRRNVTRFCCFPACHA